MYEFWKSGGMQLAGVCLWQQKKIFCLSTGNKINLRTCNIQEVHKNKILNGSNNCLFIQKMKQVQNQLTESQLNL